MSGWKEFKEKEEQMFQAVNMSHLSNQYSHVPCRFPS